MKLFMLIPFVIASFGLQAEEQDDKKITALYVISSDSRDYIGKGREKIYRPEDGTFTFSKWSDGAIIINFKSFDNEWWRLTFGGPNREPPRLGLFKNAKRHPFCDHFPGLDIDSDHRGCNRLSGEYEILELEYDADGNVKVFAANFIQKCEVIFPPLFGSIRYNSSIPIENRFKERLQKELESSTIYVSKRDAFTGKRVSLPVLITDAQTKLELRPLPFGGEGMEVVVNGENESWTFDFAAPLGSEFIKGNYTSSNRYPFHGYFEAGLGISASGFAASSPSGYFEVIDIQKNKRGDISKLILKFSVETEAGDIYEGIIKHLSQPPEMIESLLPTIGVGCSGTISYTSVDDYDYTDDEND